MARDKRKTKNGFFKDILDQILGSIVLDLIFSILTFIPRMIVRLVKNLFD
ncbi:hypothetical protein MPH61_06820 [Peribacillus muralis]|nr:hypothetical protein [Peribacillus muralis]MCK1992313.1 hypothetical protein [Peribacillus muralis]MCK2012869.1 hypothetical protein [Peribacillus muralis]